MKTRRVITGYSEKGHATVVRDDYGSNRHEFTSVPGFVTSLLWSTPSNPSISDKTVDQGASVNSWVPPVGGTNLMVITFPPDSVMTSSSFDPSAAVGEYLEHLPGLAERFEPDNPGMHTTDSIDYGIVLEGELVLELDQGEKTTVKTHDVIVQQGTRHAWRNCTAEPATVLFVLIGAERPAP